MPQAITGSLQVRDDEPSVQELSAAAASSATSGHSLRLCGLAAAELQTKLAAVQGQEAGSVLRRMQHACEFFFPAGDWRWLRMHVACMWHA
jgi:hypothetical protein